MGRSRRSQPQPVQLSLEQVEAAIPKLDRRIVALKAFDLDTICERWDPRAEALCTAVNETLKQVFGFETADYYQYSVSSLADLPVVLGGGEYSPREVREGYRRGIEKTVLKLGALMESFEERVVDESGGNETESGTPLGRPTISRRVFVAHGRNSGVKEIVARYLEQIDLQPVILHEQGNQGRTIIEKFEAHADVAYAVVLFTRDDIGHAADRPDQARPRARQNAVLELGFFAGRLGRERVCLLYEEGVEMPSDYAGVLYVQLDDAGAWRLQVAREMKLVGLEIDLNKVI